MLVATQSSSSHIVAVGKQEWGQSQHKEDGNTEDGKSSGLESIVELLNQPWIEHNWVATAL